MSVIFCCEKTHRARIFKLAPKDGYIFCLAIVLEKCPICGNFVLELERTDFKNRRSVIRYANKKAIKTFLNIKSSILFELKTSTFKPLPASKFYLYCNEFGAKRRCYSNLSGLRMGKMRDNFEDLKGINK